MRLNGMIDLREKVALITGASRGIGKGVAKSLIESGANVYITGRKNSNPDFPNVMNTCEELNKLNMGKCYGMFCDHSNEEDIKSVFYNIEKSSKKIDILVNSVIGSDNVESIKNIKYWEEDPVKMWNNIMEVGLRSAYICSVLATKMMIPAKSGLIVNISSMSAIFPIFGALYCVGKDGTDAMSLNMGLHLKKHKICVVSLWPSIVRTEKNEKLCCEDELIKKYWPIAEDPEMIGRVIASLYSCNNSLKYTGLVHYVADLAEIFKVKNNDGLTPVSPRSFTFLLYGYMRGASFIFPKKLKIPKFCINSVTSRFSNHQKHIF